MQNHPNPSPNTEKPVYSDTQRRTEAETRHNPSVVPTDPKAAEMKNEESAIFVGIVPKTQNSLRTLLNAFSVLFCSVLAAFQVLVNVRPCRS